MVELVLPLTIVCRALTSKAKRKNNLSPTLYPKKKNKKKFFFKLSISIRLLHWSQNCSTVSILMAVL